MFTSAFNNQVEYVLAASAGILLFGCASIVNDANIPLAFTFSDGVSGKCTFKNKRGEWSSDIPVKKIMIRRSDDDLVYDCVTEYGVSITGSVESEIEGGKMGASVFFFDLGITDSITDKHRTYKPETIIPVPATGSAQEGDSDVVKN